MMAYVRKIARRLYSTYMGFEEHEGSLAAAGVAYYLALSFFPLFMVLLAGLGWVLEWTAAGKEAQQSLLAAIERQVSPDLASQVERMLQIVSDKAPTGGRIGFVVLLISAIATFAQLDAAFDRIWHQPMDPHETWVHWLIRLLVKRIKALAMLLGVGGFVIIAMVTSMIWTGVKHAMEPAFTRVPWAEWASSLWINLILNLLAFTVVYKVLPKPRIRWRDAVRGGVFASLLWEAGRQALAAYLLRLNYPSAYGVVGSFLAVMLWAYYASLVILFGAEYVRVIEEEAQASKQKRIEEVEKSGSRTVVE
jgi:membrane protein